METIKPGMLYCSLDGDGIGKKVGRAVLANDVEELHKVSARIDAAQDLIYHWCKDVGGVKVSGGGDEATLAIPREAKEKIATLRESIEKAFGYTISVGVGRNLAEAGTALLVAKLTGKDKIVTFSKKIYEYIKKAKRRVREKRATPNEYKLAEAYLTKSENPMFCELHKSKVCDLHKSEISLKKSEEDDCPYCPEHGDSHDDNCQMCADYDAKNGSGGIEGCQACVDYDNKQNADGGDDCPYCEDMPVGQANAEVPETHSCNCPNCPKKDEADLGADVADPNHPENCSDCQQMHAEAPENTPEQSGQVDPNMQGRETAEQVLDSLDNEPGSSPTPAQEAQQIDNTELPQGDAMEDGTSVTEDFGPEQKNDVSDSEQAFGQEGQDDHACNCPDCPGSQEAAPEQDSELSQAMPAEEGQEEPDMAGVLQSGLDEHADEQKKQQVLDMVGQTLAGFKANKASLEATKEQNQPLYNSCIQMLKSMIALCELLGLNPQSAPAAAQDGQAPQPAQEAPAQEAAPAEGQSDPKAVG